MRELIWKPPKNFRKVKAPRDVALTKTVPSFLTKNPRRRGAKGRGKAYEAKGLAHLEERYPGLILPQPWFSFKENGKDHLQYAQPDALLFDIPAGKCVIFELKLRHTPNAWWQLRHKYQPLVERWLEGMFSVEVCEMVQWYDPHTAFPEDILMTPEPQSLLHSTFGVYIWHPRYKK